MTESSGLAVMRDDSGTAADGILQVCSLAGWPAARGGDEDVVVELEVAPLFAQAVLRPIAIGVEASVALVDIATATSPAQREALSTLLQAIEEGTRASVAVSARPRGATAVLSVEFGAAPPAPSVLAAALASLSVVYRRAVREADALLSSEALSAAYLRSAPAPSFTTQVPRSPEPPLSIRRSSFLRGEFAAVS